MAIITDDFAGEDGGRPNHLTWQVNNDLWSDGGQQCLVDINGNRLRHTLSPVPSNSGNIQSIFTISGDFDFEVEFDVTEHNDCYWSSIYAWQDIDNKMYMCANRALGFMKISSMINGSWLGYHQISNLSISTGKLRLVRSGSQAYGYYDIGSGWRIVGTISCITSAIAVVIYSNGDNNSTGNIYYDNFAVNAGKVTNYHIISTMSQPYDIGILLQSLLQQPYSLIGILARQSLSQSYKAYEAIQQLLDQPYRAYEAIRQLLDQPYRACEAIRQLLDQVYGIQLQAALRQPYNCAPLVRALLRQWYSATGQRRAVLEQLYECALMIRQPLDQPYSYPGPLRRLLRQRYAIADGQALAAARQLYAISEYDLSRRVLAQQYGLLPDGSLVQAVQATVRIGGQVMDCAHINIEGGTDQYCLSCELHLAEEADYARVGIGDEIKITIDLDYLLAVEAVERRREYPGAEYIVRGLSRTAWLDAPYADPVTGSLEGMASAIVTGLAGGIPVDYRAVDWYIPADTLLPGDDTPMDVIRAIAGASGAVVQTDPDGTLVIAPRYPVSVPDWPTAQPDHIWSDMLDFFSTGETFDHRPGYNRYLVSDQAESADTLRLDDDESSPTEHIIRAYQTPWADDFDLRHTGGDWVGLEQLGIEERAIEAEVVEFVAGEGRTQYPIYGITAMEWLRQPLGVVTSAEDGTLRAAVDGESLLRITYLTRCRKYRVTDRLAEPVQIVAEGRDE